MQQSPPPSFNTSEAPRRPYGSDPAADVASLAALSAMRADAEPASVAGFRRAALNTVDHLETQLERTVEERNLAAAKLSYRLDAAGMAKGAAVLLAELRRVIGEGDEAARRWLASQFAAVLAGTPETSAEVVAGIAGRVGRLGSERPGLAAAQVLAGDWAAATTTTTGAARTDSDAGTHDRAEVVS